MTDSAAPSGFDDTAASGPVPIVPAACRRTRRASLGDALAEPAASMAADDIEKLLRQAERSFGLGR